MERKQIIRQLHRGALRIAARMRFFWAALATIVLPAVIAFFMYGFPADSSSGREQRIWIVIGLIVLQVVFAGVLLLMEFGGRDSASVIMLLEDAQDEVEKKDAELKRRTDATRLLESALRGLNAQTCGISGADETTTINDTFIREVVPSLWAALGCKSHEHTIEAYTFCGRVGEDVGLVLADCQMFIESTVKCDPSALKGRHPAARHWSTGRPETISSVDMHSDVYTSGGCSDPLVYFSRWAAVDIPEPCSADRQGVLVITAKQEEPFAPDVLDSLRLLATVFSSSQRIVADCNNLQGLTERVTELEAELKQARQKV